MLQAFQQGQLPQLPATPAAPAQPMPAPAAPVQGAEPTLDSTALLSLILGNPAFQQGLRSAAVLGPRLGGTVQLPVPTSVSSPRAGVVPIPMSAMLPLVASLAASSRAELAEAVDEAQAGEFMLSEAGDLLVDPADDEQQQQLIAHYFRCFGEALRTGFFEVADND
jgi:hypothetical protein